MGFPYRSQGGSAGAVKEKRYEEVLRGTVGLVALGMSAPASAADMPLTSSLPAPLPVMYN
jgi:hypothetical protein